MNYHPVDPHIDALPHAVDSNAHDESDDLIMNISSHKYQHHNQKVDEAITSSIPNHGHNPTSDSDVKNTNETVPNRKKTWGETAETTNPHKKASLATIYTPNIANTTATTEKFTASNKTSAAAQLTPKKTAAATTHNPNNNVADKPIFIKTPEVAEKPSIFATPEVAAKSTDPKGQKSLISWK